MVATAISDTGGWISPATTLASSEAAPRWPRWTGGLAARYRRHADGRVPVHEVEIPHIVAQGPGGAIVTRRPARLIGFPGMADYVSSNTGSSASPAPRRWRLATTVCGSTRSAGYRALADGQQWIGDDPALEKQVVDLHPIGALPKPKRSPPPRSGCARRSRPSCSAMRSRSTAATRSSRRHVAASIQARRIVMSP